MIKQLQVNIETINLFGRFLSVAHGPTWCYCSSKPFFSLLLSSLTVTAGAGEARFSGSAAPAAEAGATGALPNRLNWIFDEFSRARQSSRAIIYLSGLMSLFMGKNQETKKRVRKHLRQESS